MLRKGVCFVLLLLVVSFVGAGAPMAVRGTVYDIVTERGVDFPDVTVTCGADVYTAFTQSSPDSSGLSSDGFDAFTDCGKTGGGSAVIKVRAQHPSDKSCYWEGSFSVQTGNNLDLEIGICCYPTRRPSMLSPGVKFFGEPRDVTFTWVAGEKGTGGNRDNPLYQSWDVFRYGGYAKEGTSPVVVKDISQLPAWSVQRINGIRGDPGRQCALSPTTVTPGGSNKPCPEPENLLGSYSEGVVYTKWDSADFDEEGHACHDEWRGRSMKSGQGLDNAEHDWSYVYEPDAPNAETITAELVTYWQVRSCDFLGEGSGGCSEWVYMITPSCNEVSGSCPVLEERGGGGSRRLVSEEESPLASLLLKRISWWWILLVIAIVVSGYISYKYYKKSERMKKMRKIGELGKVGQVKVSGKD